MQRHARVAQLVEHATENRSVGSSILPPGTIFCPLRAKILGARGSLGRGATLIYATGGAAFGMGSIALSVSSGGFSASASKDFTATGFVFGGGVEARFAQNWSGRVEGLRYSFSEISSGGSSATVDMNVNVVRAGLSWHPN